MIPEFEVAIGNPQGDLVSPDETGEILIRPRETGTVMTEYIGMPEATSAVFRGLWLHTGDRGRLDADGFLYFVGRIKDSIRRRGENISLAEVEAVLSTHPDVIEVAAFGVDSELSEEDLKVCVVLRDGSHVTWEALAAHCAARAPGFMVPRYFELVSELPKTPTQKVEKFKLRAAGLTSTTWDRESVTPEGHA